MLENIPENGFKYETFELDNVEITPCPEKKVPLYLILPLTLPNVNRSSEFFH